MFKMRQFLSIGLALLAAGSTAASVQVVEGEIGPGAHYALFVPDDWNGDLALYAHGFRDPAEPIDLPTADQIEALRDRLLEEGFAVAYSSYSENGLAVKDGGQRTQQLRGIFVSEFAPPQRTYLMGHSLGGLVAIMLAEEHSNHYDGVLSMCGLLGGSQAQVDYVADLRALFDVFYPGVLPGDVLNIPEDVDLEGDVIVPILLAIQADPTGAVAISNIDQTPVPWSTGEELVESFIRGVGFQFRGLPDVMGRTHGQSPFGNVDIVYTGSLPPEVLGFVNASVGRFESTPAARNYLEHYYQPDGDISIPVLTLHNNLDPVAPIFHETLYQSIVQDAGNADLLVQRTIDRYGHCALEVEEMIDAFLDLVDWVETGDRPAP